MRTPKETKDWLARIGKKGGLSKSPKKIAAVTANLSNYWRSRGRGLKTPQKDEAKII